jgi:hypothetical protein
VCNEGCSWGWAAAAGVILALLLLLLLLLQVLLVLLLLLQHPAVDATHTVHEDTNSNHPSNQHVHG